MSALPAPKPDPSAVLLTATLRAAEHLGLGQRELGEILGIDRTSVARMVKRGQLSPESKQGELALLLVRVYRSLFALLGDNQAQLRHWMRTENLHLGGVPAERLSSVQGLVETVSYLDALRGRN
jgi:hypothetical protein